MPVITNPIVTPRTRPQVSPWQKPVFSPERLCPTQTEQFEP